jgi:hypothetical protein
MSTNEANLIAKARAFFAAYPADQLPPVLGESGDWQVYNGRGFSALFFMSESAMERIREYRAENRDPFPMFFAPDKTDPASIVAAGKNSFYDSNVTDGGYAMYILSGATCIVHNHHHTAKDELGNALDYVVELAFVVGDQVANAGGSADDAFVTLFNRLVTLWKTRNNP